MNKLTVSFKNILLKFTSLKKRISAIFWLALLIIFVLEFFVISNSINLILGMYKNPQAVKKTPGVRINFENYNYVIERMEKGKTFQNSPRVSKNPFGQK